MQCYDNVILTGTPADPGLMVLSLSQIFRERATYAQTADEEFTVTASYLEVYNEVCIHPWPFNKCCAASVFHQRECQQDHRHQQDHSGHHSRRQADMHDEVEGKQTCMMIPTITTCSTQSM